jgi:hypothetical protein
MKLFPYGIEPDKPAAFCFRGRMGAAGGEYEDNKHPPPVRR